MPPTKPDPYLGKLFAERFLVLDKLGEGSMGTVYEARELAQSRPAALKLIHKHLAIHKKISDRFRREMELTARIESPYVVKVYDYGQAPGGELYLAMEMIDGKSLSEVIARGGPMEPSRVVDIAVQICHAMADAHRRNIIHRDLKPDNVMLIQTDKGEEVRILDFGVARVVDTSQEEEGGVQITMTRAGSPLGTLPYMSPQQIACETLDFSTDLYSLGVVIYEMLAGAPPFKAATRKQALNDHLFKQPPPLREKNPKVTAGLAMIVNALLEKEPEERPRSADEVIQRLRASTPRSRPTGMPSDSMSSSAMSATMVPDLTDPPLDSPSTPPEESPRLPSNLAAVPNLNRSMAQSNAQTMVPDADDEETLLLPPVDHLLGEGEGQAAKGITRGNLAELARAAQAIADAPAPPPPAPAPPPPPRDDEPLHLVASDASAESPPLALMVLIAVVVALAGMLAGAAVMWAVLS